MTETELQNALKNAIDGLISARDEIAEADMSEEPEAFDGAIADFTREAAEELEAVERVRTFEEAELLSSNQGLVLRLSGGREFQITIVRSR